MAKCEPLLLATSNTKKLEEMKQILSGLGSIEVVGTSEFPGVEDPEETETTFAGNARLKAVYYSQKTGLTALADDSGLVIDALDGAPGVQSARYAPTDAERISRVLREMKDAGTGHRSARFVCAMCVARNGEVIAEEEGTLEGSISLEPRGGNGFGYDPIFIVGDSGRHLAELSSKEKNGLSHRGNALNKIIPALLIALGCGTAAGSGGAAGSH